MGWMSVDRDSDPGNSIGNESDSISSDFGRADREAILNDMEANRLHNESIESGGEGTGYMGLPPGAGPGNRTFMQENITDPASSMMRRMTTDPLDFFTPSARTGWQIGAHLVGSALPIPFTGPLFGWAAGQLYDQPGLTEEQRRKLEEQRALQSQYADYGGGGSDKMTMAQNLIQGPSQTSQVASQPQASTQTNENPFDMGSFGRGMISAQGRQERGNIGSSAAERGMGSGSGNIQGQMQIANQQQQERMRQYAQMMSDPNMGYNDLAASLQNILT